MSSAFYVPRFKEDLPWLSEDELKNLGEFIDTHERCMKKNSGRTAVGEGYTISYSHSSIGKVVFIECPWCHGKENITSWDSL